MRLYHYTSFNSFIRIWFTQKLLFGDPSFVNDIFEQDHGVAGSIFLFRTIYRIEQQISKFRQISLTKDYSEMVLGCMSPMMWGHYGDKGNGVCIELDVPRLKIPPKVIQGDIEYISGVPPIPKFPDSLENASACEIRNFIRNNNSSFLFKKTKDWSYENEYRLVSDSVKSISIKHAIKRIIVKKCNTVESDIILQLIDEYNKGKDKELQIDVCYLHRAEEEGEHIYKLTPLQIIKDTFFPSRYSIIKRRKKVREFLDNLKTIGIRISSSNNKSKSS